MEPTITVTLTLSEARALIEFIEIEAGEFLSARTQRLADYAVDTIKERMYRSTEGGVTPDAPIETEED